MDNFKSIGNSANNVFKQILFNHIDNIHNRHMARILGILEDNYVERYIVELVKKEVGLYGCDVKSIINAIGGKDDGK